MPARTSSNPGGVARLAGRRCKVVGLGGVGSIVAQGLVHYLSSSHARCPVWLIDGDDYEENNRSRVVFESCENKAMVKAAELAALARGALTVVGVPRYVTPRNAPALIEEGDVILLCVDNHLSRRSVSNRCRKLRDVLLISGGNDGIEAGRTGTYGNVMVYRRENGRERTNPLTRLHPEIARPAGKAPYQLSCAELAQSAAPQLLFTNMQVAVAMLSAFYAWLSGKLAYEEVAIDILAGRMVPIARRLS